ncbi:MAG: SDR family oxidoreductase [Planctomycetales bacterium]|nr:SDR family oxidoreductase [Planctomycetales bacterium]
MNVLITGGTRGLGLEITRQLLDAEHRVYVVGRRLSPELERLSHDHPSQVSFLEYDLADPFEIKQRLFDEGVGIDTPLHGLVNNAALAYDDLVTNLDMNRLQEMFQTNVFAPMQLTKYAIRNMLLHKVSGSLVHVSSVSAHTGYKGLAMYASTKGALEAFSKNVAREWGSLGIRSNCVVPGFMETDMSAGIEAEQKQRIYQRSALKQPTDISSVATTVLFLLSDTSRSITGQNVIVDAGTV